MLTKTKGGQATSRSAISPPLKWHIDGGKQYLASRLHEIASRTACVHRVHTHAGGLGELWDWPHEGVSEVVNDLNGWLTNFWDVLRDRELFPQFMRFVQATPFSEPLFLSARDVVSRSKKPDGLDPVTAAAWFFVCVRQSMAGRMKCFAPLSRTRVRRKMNEQASAWMTAVEGLPEAHARLMPVVIYNKRDVEVIRQQDGPDTLFYCDPPYLPDTRTSPSVYAFEMTRRQHVELLRTLLSIRGKFMLSGYDNRLYRAAERMGGWKRHVFELPNNAAGGESKRRMIEVVWCNF